MVLHFSLHVCVFACNYEAIIRIPHLPSIELKFLYLMLLSVYVCMYVCCKVEDKNDRCPLTNLMDFVYEKLRRKRGPARVAEAQNQLNYSSRYQLFSVLDFQTYMCREKKG